MKAIPDKIKTELRPNLTIIWWGRRSVFEIVEEVSEGIYRNLITWCAFIMIAQIFDSTPLVNIIIVFAGISFFASAKMINEILSWYHEIHIVAADEANGNGRVYKFYGWLNSAHIDEAITPRSPTKLVERPWYTRLWGWITGQRMERVRLYSQNHTFVEGKKMPYAYSRAINSVGGYKPVDLAETPDSLAALPLVQQLVSAGLLDRKTAEASAEAIIRQIAFGSGNSGNQLG